MNGVVAKPCPLNLRLHEKQVLAFESKATEILYGGAAGGGKSFLMRIAAIVWCATIPGLQVYLFRRVSADLTKNHVEGPKGFRAVLAPWVAEGFCRIVDDQIRFWNGSKIYLCHCEEERHIYKYLGSEIHVLIIDELTTFTETMYRFLRNRVRMVGVTLPKNYEGRFPRILCGSNPGNIGHLFVKQTFIDNRVPFEVTKTSPKEGGMLRQYIPAQLDDNPSMSSDDPGYEDRLEGLGNKQLIRAMRYGDWSVIEGAYFDEWNPLKHVIRSFSIPSHWTRFMAGDWGSAHPFAFGWFAVVPDEMDVDVKLIVGARDDYSPAYQNNLPANSIVMYREWYGSRGHNNVGLKMPAEEAADGINDREMSEPRDERGRARIAFRKLDPSCFISQSGPTIAERMATRQVFFDRADNSRIPIRGSMGGWDQLRARLLGDARRDESGDIDWNIGRPMLYFFESCIDTIRTLPAMQHDPHKPEDVHKIGEDHLADMVRYAVMSRPYSRPVGRPVPDRIVSVGAENQLRISDVLGEDEPMPRRRSSGRI